MVSSNHYDLDIDTTLGGSNASDYVVASQKAIKDYVDNHTGSIPNPAYGTSSTAAATAQKVVSIPAITSLNVGQVLYIRPSTTSTVANSTIKLNDFDAYPMRYNNAAITTSTDSIVWGASFVSIFVFDGSYWQFCGHGIDSNTTYSAMSVSEGTTGTATSSRVMRADYLKQIIQGTKLTGLSTSDSSDVEATDTVLGGIGKLQAQINASKILINITYDDLVTLKTNEELYEGAFYRITDYVTTTNGASPNNNEPSRSAEHQFDIIIQALGTSNLADKGTCALHENDTYFANNNLGAWTVYYDIENDTTKYAWADTTNGKGVIYRLIDEFGNDLPYDFKNIQFYRDSANYTSIASYLTASDGYYYTFSKNTSGTITDKSLDALTHDNIIGQYIDANNTMLLLNTTFVHTSTTVTDTNNIGSNSYNNTFVGSCYGNTIGMMCHDNIVDNNFIYNNISHVFRSNTVGTDCKSNKIGNYCYENIISINFYYNQLGDYFYGNTISKTFGYNTIGHSFYNNNCQNTAGTNYGVYRCTIGNVVYNNTISDSFLRCTLGNNILSMTIGSNVICSDIGSFVAYSTIGNGCNSLILEPNSRYFDIPANTNYLTLGSNCSGTSGARLSLSGLPTSNTYSVYVNRDISGGVIAKWNDGITIYGKYKATSGTATWTDVNNKQVQSDWNQSDSTAVDYIKNKPTIPSGVIVDQTYDGTSTNAQSGVAIEGELTTNYQSKLVSGTNIKTVNNTSLLGSGNIDTSEIFVAEYGVTSYADVQTAYNSGKTVYCVYITSTLINYNYFYLSQLGSSGTFTFFRLFGDYVNKCTLDETNGWSLLTDYQFEQTSNKVTSISSSSTNTQYPSAKCVYDELTDKADTDLSNLSSTGQKVIDGQWVQSFITLMNSNGTKNGVQVDLSNYLPNDGYNYDVKFSLRGYDDDSSYYYHIETDIFDDGDTSTGNSNYLQLQGGTYSRQNVNIFDLPVGTGRYIKVYGSGADNIFIYALGYRRLGTNS